MGPTIKYDEIELVDLFTPDAAVKPGGLMKDVTLRIRTHNHQANVEHPADPDHCGGAGSPCEVPDKGSRGWCAQARFTLPQDLRFTDPGCFLAPLPGRQNTYDIPIDLHAPAQMPPVGDVHTIRGGLIMSGSEETSPELTEAIIMSENGAETVTTQPPEPKDGGDGPFDDILPEGLGRKLLLLGAGYVVLKTVSETATEEAFN